MEIAFLGLSQGDRIISTAAKRLALKIVEQLGREDGDARARVG